jgi:hypothetical protein
VRHDAAGRSGRQHEAVRLLGWDRRTVKAIAADASALQYLVRGSRYHEHLPKVRVPLNVTGLLEEVGPHSASGLTKKLGDVQNAEFSPGAQRGRQLGTGDVQRRAGGNAERLKIEDTGRGISQNSPRAGTSFRSCRRGSYIPRAWWGRASRNGYMSAWPAERGTVGTRERPKRSLDPSFHRSLLAYQPSRYAPVRNGFVSRSTPMVVSGPWPL